MSTFTSMRKKSTNNNILWIRERFSWMGQHSGYDQLFSFIENNNLLSHPASAWRDADKLPPMGLRKLLRLLFINRSKSPFYDQASTRAEISGIYQILRRRPQLVHIAYLENNMSIIPLLGKKLSFKTIGTAHQPVSWWRLIHCHPEVVSMLNALIVPASNQVEYFEPFLPNRVFFIPHGVDSHFFQPQKDHKNFEQPRAIFRCVYSGKWLRDTDTMAKIIENIIDQHPQIEFEMIVPQNKRWDESFFRAARHKQVKWHTNISDEELREIYQKSNVLVLPMIASTVNNSILEAIACGLPIVTNDVGGIRDYTQDTFADLLPVGDIKGMTQAILNLIKYPEKQKQMGIAARQFAEKYLCWCQIAEKTTEVYKEVLK